MLKYTIKRFALMLLTLFAVILIAFIIIRYIPGSLLDDPNLTDDARAVIVAAHMEGQPLHTQFLSYIHRIFRYGDFGTSRIVEPGVPVFGIISRRLPVTAAINAAALLLALPLGTLLAVTAALGRGKISGKAVIFMSVVLVSVPSFVLATLLRYFIAFRLDLLPILYIPGGGFFEQARSLILPVLALAVAPTALIIRLLRAELVETKNTDFYQFAAAKGLSRSAAMRRHALPYSTIPLIPVIALMFTDVLAGSLVVERVFSIPGMGGILIDSVLTRDLDLALAVIIFFTVAELLVLFIADVLLAVIDPEIKFS